MSVKFQDYYAVLGVARDAQEDDIRKAYRRLARQRHPDVDKTAGATERFKQLQEAYEVLKDPATRQRYDALGPRWKEGQEFTPPPGWGGFAGSARPGEGSRTFTFDENGFSPFFEMFFGRSGGGFGSGGSAGGDVGADYAEAFGHGRRPRAGASIEGGVTIELEDAYRGATRSITLQSEDPRVPARTFDVKIPPGTTHGSTIRLRGQGHPGSGGAPAGDLLLRVEIRPHPRFDVEGHDLSTIVPITPSEAALGAKVTVRTLDPGEALLTIPAGSSSGKKLRLRGLGLPRGGGVRGDLIAKLRIVVPTSLSEEEKRLYAELGRVSRFDPRA